jgi:CheY-like chemotaxis protein
MSDMEAGRAMPKILVVDDEDAVLFTTVANLELEGFEVVGATGAAEALAAIRTQRFDLVLSDVRMPGMDGVELFRRIRQIDRDVPVVLMTAFALEGLVEEALREGAFAVLPKPLPVDQLLRSISRALRRPVVLVVDDAPAVADSTAAALREAGVSAQAVYDGPQALAAIESRAVDVCVVDLVMPGVDGSETIRRIVAQHPAMVCIAVSGQDVPDLVRRVAVAAFAVLRKPVSPLDLVMTVARARSSTVLLARAR